MVKPYVTIEKLRTDDVLLMVMKDSTVVPVMLTRARARKMIVELKDATRSRAAGKRDAKKRAR